MAVCPVRANSRRLRPEFKPPGRVFPLLFTSFGIPIDIRTNAAEIIPLLLQHLPPGWKPMSATPKRSYLLRLAGCRGSLSAYRCEKPRSEDSRHKTYA